MLVGGAEAELGGFKGEDVVAHNLYVGDDPLKLALFQLFHDPPHQVQPVNVDHFVVVNDVYVVNVAVDSLELEGEESLGVVADGQTVGDVLWLATLKQHHEVLVAQ